MFVYLNVDLSEKYDSIYMRPSNIPKTLQILLPSTGDSGMLRVLTRNSTFFSCGQKYMILSLITNQQITMETLKIMLGRISHPKHSTKLPEMGYTLRN